MACHLRKTSLLHVVSVLFVVSMLAASVEGTQIAKRYSSTRINRRQTLDAIGLKYSPYRYAFYLDATVGAPGDRVKLRVTDQPWFWVGGSKPQNCAATEENKADYTQCVYADFSGLYYPEYSKPFVNATSTANATSTDETSVSLKKGFHIEQIDNFYTAQGYYARDQVILRSGSADVVRFVTTFGVAKEFTIAPELGLGYQYSGNNSSLSHIHELYDKLEAGAAKGFGLYLGWMQRNESSFSLGSVDIAKYEGNLLIFEAESKTPSKITIVETKGASFGSPDKKITLKGFNNLKANIEFSTPRISLPDKVIPDILERTNAQWDHDWNGWFVDCALRTSNLALTIKFQGMDIAITANHLILEAWGIGGYRFQHHGEPACVLQIDSMGNYTRNSDAKGYDAVLGTPFVRHIYLVTNHTNRQISFAPVKFNATETSLKILEDQGGVAALNRGDQVWPVITVTPTPDKSSKPSTGVIVASVLGGIALLLLVGIIIYVFLIRPKSRKKAQAMADRFQASQPANLRGSDGRYSHAQFQAVQPETAYQGGGGLEMQNWIRTPTSVGSPMSRYLRFEPHGNHYYTQELPPYNVDAQEMPVGRSSLDITRPQSMAGGNARQPALGV